MQEARSHQHTILLTIVGDDRENTTSRHSKLV
jgi:hypothetical protein